MAIRVVHKLLIQISGDTGQKQKRFFTEDDASIITDVATFDRQAGSDINIPDAATEVLNFGDVTAVRGLYLEVDQPCSLRLNGGNETLPIILAPTAAKAKVFLEMTLTGASLQNASGNTLNGSYVVWGDANQ